MEINRKEVQRRKFVANIVEVLSDICVKYTTKHAKVLIQQSAHCLLLVVAELTQH
jgi:hypothetical protein